jgi:hypothetical protein
MSSTLRLALWGAAAGAAGTTALNGLTYVDNVFRGRAASSTPEVTVEKLSEVTHVSIPGDEDSHDNRVSGTRAPERSARRDRHRRPPRRYARSGVEARPGRQHRGGHAGGNGRHERPGDRAGARGPTALVREVLGGRSRAAPGLRSRDGRHARATGPGRRCIGTVSPTWRGSSGWPSRRWGWSSSPPACCLQPFSSSPGASLRRRETGPTATALPGPGDPAQPRAAGRWRHRAHCGR